MKMLNLLLNYVVCSRRLEFTVKHLFKVKMNVRNGIPMSELVKIDLLFVKIAYLPAAIMAHESPNPWTTTLPTV